MSVEREREREREQKGSIMKAGAGWATKNRRAMHGIFLWQLWQVARIVKKKEKIKEEAVKGEASEMSFHVTM